MVSSSVGKINEGMENETIVEGYRRSALRMMATFIVFLLSFGLVSIFLTWKRSWKIKATHSRCSLDSAEKLLLIDENGMEFEENVTLVNIDYKNNIKQKRYFSNKKLKYFWSNRKGRFVKITCFDAKKPLGSFHNDLATGLHKHVIEARRQVYGPNSLDIEVKSFLHLLVAEAVNPFYIFQTFSVLIWMVFNYYLYAVCILVFSLTSIFVCTWETRKQILTLKKTVTSMSMVTVVREGEECTIASSELVPGDVIILSSSDILMECDAVLLSGQCILNESVLTGESDPVAKVAVSIRSQETLDLNIHKRLVLFSGTEILQTKDADSERVKAVVLRTGFETMKGELVRSILYPKPLELNFYSDFMKFFMIFISLCFCAVNYTAVMLVLNKAIDYDIVSITLGVMTFAIPPILPAIYTLINIVAQHRLKELAIYCISSKYINLSAGISVMCFDKTGTLTENDCSLLSVIPVVQANFKEPVEDPSQLPFSPFVSALATCHSLSLIKERLIGYPLDLVVFQSLTWIFEYTTSDVEDDCSPIAVKAPAKNSEDIENKLIILKQFPFESGIRRMSVITRVADTNIPYYAYVKGAPETIASLCLPHSVPQDFENVLHDYTRQGYRVIAVAWKSLPEKFRWDDVKNLSRDAIESDLEFIGLIILHNVLKPESKNTIKRLNDADIRSVMATGDNLNTAIHAAKKSEMVLENDRIILINAKTDVHNKISVSFQTMQSFESKEAINGDMSVLQKVQKIESVVGKTHFALDGATFNLLQFCDQKVYKKIICQSTIYARMLPEQKVNLVASLQAIGYQVGMCGDGANDCGALKAAQVGLSMSTAEASVAAPFTSKNANISSVIDLIIEGRAALVSCIGMIKFQVAYIYTELLLTLVLIYIACLPSSEQYLFMDLGISLLPAIFIGTTQARYPLSKERPIMKLLSVTHVASLLSFLIIQGIFYAFIWNYCKSQPWYVEYKYKPGNPSPNYETSSLLPVSITGMLIACVMFFEGPPFQQPLYTNKVLVALLILEFFISAWWFIYPTDTMIMLLGLKMAPEISFREIVFAIAVACSLACFIWDKVFIRRILQRIMIPYVKRVCNISEPYQKIQADLDKDSNWPPLGESLTFEMPTVYDILRKQSIRRSKRNRSKSTVSAISAMSV